MPTRGLNISENQSILGLKIQRGESRLARDSHRNLADTLIAEQSHGRSDPISITSESPFDQRVAPGSGNEDTEVYDEYTEGRSPWKSCDVKVPTLNACQKHFVNEEAEKAFRRLNPIRNLVRTLQNVAGAFYIVFAHTFSFETLVTLANAALVTLFYVQRHERFAAKLSFGFLAFSVIFPLSFLIQSTFRRRERALEYLADFRSCVLSTALFTFTVDWADGQGNPTGGRRRSLPPSFDTAALQDFRRLLKLVHQHLSMPSVDHARHTAFWFKQPQRIHIYSRHNYILKCVNEIMVDLSSHTEVMRKAGFSSGEASRLHQFHQYAELRFEKLRNLKLYRTPQATRSFGRVFIYLLPWWSGPYFAWVYEEMGVMESYAFPITLAMFTFLVLQGLLNTQQAMEDPFLVNYLNWTPGIDTVKLDYEFAIALQAVEQYYAEAQARWRWQGSGAGGASCGEILSTLKEDLEEDPADDDEEGDQGGPEEETG